MSGFYDRLGDILRDRLNSDEDPFAESSLFEGKPRSAGNSQTRAGQNRRRDAEQSEKSETVAVPRDLIPHFQNLGMRPGSPEDECKKAWKRLLLRHHPDTNAGNEASQAKASALCAGYTESYRAICRWYSGRERP